MRPAACAHRRVTGRCIQLSTTLRSLVLGAALGLLFCLRPSLALAAPAADSSGDKAATSTDKATGKKSKKSKKEKKKKKNKKKKKSKESRAARRKALFTEEAEGGVSSELGSLSGRLGEAKLAIEGALKVASASAAKSDEENAKRLVEGQLLLQEDPERAAIIFLGLTEGYPEAPAGLQARFFLGEALYLLEMSSWAAECFQQNLADKRGDAVRYHQRSLARLLDLGAPRRQPGFARRPGLSALPELRGRLRALGLPVTRQPPDSVLDDAAMAAIVLRVEAIAGEDRGAELRYAYGRYLHIRGEEERAIAELDALNPMDIPLSRGGPDARWRVRAAYLAAVATLAAGDVDDALSRFAAIIKSHPSRTNSRDRAVVELAWLARARIHHDRGDFERSLKAYRRIGRASPYYFTAVYESAWVLIRADRFALAAQALERLLAIEPGGPLVPEIRQLGGKLRILQGDLVGAEAAFAELSKEFEGRALALASTVAPAEYFSAIVGADMEGFDLAAVIPRSSVAIARSLPRASQAESIGQTIGVLDRELTELRAQLTRMEAAINAPERVRLFTDLGGQTAVLDGAEWDLVEVMEGLCARAGAAIDAKSYGKLEEQRLGLRASIAEPLSEEDKLRSPQRRIDRLGDFLEQLKAAHAALEAQVTAAEYGLLESASRNAKLSQVQVEAVIEMRTALAALAREADDLQEVLGGVEVELRFNDPYRGARAVAMIAYRRYLGAMYAAILKSAPDKEGAALWKQSQQLASQLGVARGKLDEAAGARLARALGVLREERVNLDQIKNELMALRGTAQADLGAVIHATYSDVAGEIANWQMRSEVGVLDVAWARKESEAKAAQHLERERDRDRREIDRALEMAEELSR
ncbi:MAG TPA: hypothetical protein ENJ18_12465 [Nannocystis exedens]|nr:hypothetical protein [Nannocystis exedens]